MNNLLNSMQVATIFLDTNMRVKRYTDQARDVVRLISSDIGRPLSDLTSSLVYPTLIADCERVLASLIPMEKEIPDNAGRWYLVRLMPYRTADNVIEGLVMTIVDIDRTKQVEEKLRRTIDTTNAAENALKSILDQLPLGVVIANQPDVTIQAVSRYSRELTGRSAESLIGIAVDKHVEAFDFYRVDGSRPGPEELPLTRAAVTGEVVRNEVWVVGRRDGTRIPLLTTAAPIRGPGGRILGAIAAWEDLTELKRFEEELRRLEKP
jgi:PAS domain S-box-containing protein